MPQSKFIVESIFPPLQLHAAALFRVRGLEMPFYMPYLQPVVLWLPFTFEIT